MTHYYSQSGKGFYSSNVHGENIPEDKILLEDAEYKSLVKAAGCVAISPSGRPEVKPSQHHTLNGAGDAWEITDESQATIDAGNNAVAREEGIKTAKNGSGLKKITIEQAYSFIDDKLDTAFDEAELKEAIRVILKKMIPHILD